MSARRPSSRGALVVLLVGLAGCDGGGAPATADGGFAAIYARRCAGCHGADGANGPAPPLSDPLFLAIVPDAALRDVITNGRPGTAMPAFGAAREGGSLSPQQVDILVRGMRARWGKQASGEESLPAYALKRGAPGDARAGAATFAQACARCHGARGEGGSGGAVHDPAFLRLVSPQRLRRMVITGRPDVGAPDFRHAREDGAPLTPREVADLVALLRAWRQESASPTDPPRGG